MIRPRFFDSDWSMRNAVLVRVRGVPIDRCAWRVLRRIEGGLLRGACGGWGVCGESGAILRFLIAGNERESGRFFGLLEMSAGKVAGRTVW